MTGCEDLATKHALAAACANRIYHMFTSGHYPEVHKWQRSGGSQVRNHNSQPRNHPLGVAQPWPGKKHCLSVARARCKKMTNLLGVAGGSQVRDHHSPPRNHQLSVTQPGPGEEHCLSVARARCENTAILLGVASFSQQSIFACRTPYIMYAAISLGQLLWVGG